MSNSEFMLNFLPSFFRQFMVDENGESTLLPLFDIYLMFYSDLLSQSQQIAQFPYLERTEPLLKENYVTVNIRNENKFKDGYKINNEIVFLSDPYYDAKFLNRANVTFSIKHDFELNQRYIVFNNLETSFITNNVLYCEYCYKDKQALQSIHGSKLNYTRFIEGFTSTLDYNKIVTDYNLYKKELIALWYLLFNGPTVTNIENALHIFTGSDYAEFDGTVVQFDYNYVTIEDASGFKKQYTTNKEFELGQIITKFTPFRKYITVYDIFSDPARFTQKMLFKNADLVNDNLILSKNVDAGEEHAYLTYDSLLTFDQDRIVWDFGYGTNKIYGQNNYQDPLEASSIESSFADWECNYQDMQDRKIYESFRNIFIVDHKTTLPDQNYENKLKYFLSRIKPVHSKYYLCFIPTQGGGPIWG